MHYQKQLNYVMKIAKHNFYSFEINNNGNRTRIIFEI